MKYLIAAALLAASFTVSASQTNNGCQGNCPNDGGGTSTSTATGGNANALAGAVAGAAALAGASVGDVTNVAQGGAGGHSTAISAGGAGGKGGEGGTGIGFGGDAKQSQHNVGINGQSLDNKISNGLTSTIGATGTGNTTTTNVGGDTTLVERNAPPVFLGNLTATMSCAGSFNAGGSDRNGSGAFGFTWTSRDCRSVVIGKEFVGIGMPDVACRIWKTTKGFKRAAKADPALADVDCAIKQEPAKPSAAITFPLTDRVPRG